MAKRLFHWSSVLDCVMHETDGDGNTLVTYTREPVQYGPLISEHRNGQEYVHHYDALGSTTMLTDETGSVTDTFTYDAWGNQVARTGTTETPYRWVGKWGYQFDSSTGGYYVRARVYQPTIARWMSFDPIGFTDGHNRYCYVTDNPILFVDQSGEKCCVCRWRRQISREKPLILDRAFTPDALVYTREAVYWASSVNRLFSRVPMPFVIPITPEPPQSGLWHYISRDKTEAGNAYLFFISADICEDKPGDCQFDLVESQKWLEKSTGGPFVRQTRNPDGTLVDTPAGGPAPIMGNLVPAAQHHPPCRQRVVWADMPSYYAFYRHRTHGTQIFAWGARQDYKIGDRSGGAPATLRFFFEMRPSTVPPLRARFSWSSDSHIPTRSECATCC